MPYRKEFWVIQLTDGRVFYLCDTEYCENKAEVIDAFYNNNSWIVPNQRKLLTGRIHGGEKGRLIPHGLVASLSRKVKTIFVGRLVLNIIWLTLLVFAYTVYTFNSNNYILANLDTKEAKVSLDNQVITLTFVEADDSIILQEINNCENSLNSLNLIFNKPQCYEIVVTSENADFKIYRKMLRDTTDWYYLVDTFRSKI